MTKSRPSFTKVAALTVVLTIVASGCSWTQVQAWFAIRGASVTEAQARSVADQVNAKSPRNCDTNYGACIPDNITSAHCVGYPGTGMAITGPIKIHGWDHLKLGRPGSNVACDGSPIGGLDSVTVTADGKVRLSGWAYDSSTSKAIQVHGYAGSNSAATIANRARHDLGALGHRRISGYTVDIAVSDGRHKVCAYGMNVGPGANVELGCRTVLVGDAANFIARVDAIRASRGLPATKRCDLLALDAADLADHRETPGQGTLRRYLDEYGQWYPGETYVLWIRDYKLARGALDTVNQIDSANWNETISIRDLYMEAVLKDDNGVWVWSIWAGAAGC